jgi:hypothetical protein
MNFIVFVLQFEFLAAESSRLLPSGPIIGCATGDGRPRLQKIACNLRVDREESQSDAGSQGVEH